MTLVILDVVGDPVLAFRSIGSGEQPQSAKVFTGQCRIGDDPSQKFLARLTGGRGPLRLGFYVPGAGPLSPSHLLSTWAEVSLSTMQVTRGADSAFPGPYGVDTAVVELVDDGKGSGSQWPYVWFTAYGGEPMVIRYRLTVTQPVD